MVFLVDTLDFVFVFSDLIEAGWKAREWDSEESGVLHKFGRYLNRYNRCLRALHAQSEKPHSVELRVLGLTLMLIARIEIAAPPSGSLIASDARCVAVARSMYRRLHHNAPLAAGVT